MNERHIGEAERDASRAGTLHELRLDLDAASTCAGKQMREHHHTPETRSEIDEHIVAFERNLTHHRDDRVDAAREIRNRSARKLDIRGHVLESEKRIDPCVAFARRNREQSLEKRGATKGVCRFEHALILREAMTKKSPYASTLAASAKRLAKAKPAKVYGILHEAFLVFVAAGHVAEATAIVRLIYGGKLPRPTEVVHALGTGPMDGFCAAAGLGDLTKGEPATEFLASAKTFAERLRVSEEVVRERLTDDAYTQFRKPKAKWTALEGRELYRKAQLLASSTSTEPEALAAFTKYMDAWCNDPEDRGAGYGQEIALVFDLALRHGARDRIAGWLPVLGSHLLDWEIHEALCLPVLAKAIAEGLLAPLVALPKDQAKTLCRAIAAAVPKASAAPAKAGKPARRTVSAEYSQFHVGHAESDPDEVFFQHKRESPQGFSLFATKVGIATPTDTAECVVTLAVARGEPKAKIEAAVQAVAFPFVVSGPLFVRSVTGGDDDEDDEVLIPNGRYNVLACFFPKRAAKEDAEVGLRAFDVTLDFYPPSALDAPKCIKLEHGKPPKKTFVQPGV